jgi:hypothetical protein
VNPGEVDVFKLNVTAEVAVVIHKININEPITSFLIFFSI